MIQHVIERARASGAQEVIVATDDARIEACCLGFGAQVVMTSPEHQSGTDRIAEVAMQLGWQDQDIVVNVQGDEPLISPAVIVQVASVLQSHSQAGIATLCEPIDKAEDLFNPNVVKLVRNKEDFALYFSRAPIPWDRDQFAQGQSLSPRMQHLRHIGLYAYRVDCLRQLVATHPVALEQTESLEQLRALYQGIAIIAPVACESNPAGVDTQEDLDRVEKMLVSA